MPPQDLELLPRSSSDEVADGELVILATIFSILSANVGQQLLMVRFSRALGKVTCN
jgi:hypothetical protein